MIRKTDLPLIPKQAEEELLRAENRFDDFVRVSYIAGIQLIVPSHVLGTLHTNLQTEFWHRVAAAGWEIRHTEDDVHNSVVTYVW